MHRFSSSADAEIALPRYPVSNLEPTFLAKAGAARSAARRAFLFKEAEPNKSAFGDCKGAPRRGALGTKSLP